MYNEDTRALRLPQIRRCIYVVYRQIVTHPENMIFSIYNVLFVYMLYLYIILLRESTRDSSR